MIVLRVESAVGASASVSAVEPRAPLAASHRGRVAVDLRDDRTRRSATCSELVLLLVDGRERHHPRDGCADRGEAGDRGGDPRRQGRAGHRGSRSGSAAPRRRSARGSWRKRRRPAPRCGWPVAAGTRSCSWGFSCRRVDADGRLPRGVWAELGVGHSDPAGGRCRPSAQ